MKSSLGNQVMVSALEGPPLRVEVQAEAEVEVSCTSTVKRSVAEIATTAPTCAGLVVASVAR
ncbi:hypothetical protein ACFYTS_10780 [Nocardia sp. NPDC004151]|uniref:hypothetical protein n=1 Tax=Nocardia sp. NPDC004151 TaxID=3364304 RepID=UPI00367548B9